jgi:putative oxidoreductase
MRSLRGRLMILCDSLRCKQFFSAEQPSNTKIRVTPGRQTGKVLIATRCAVSSPGIKSAALETVMNFLKKCEPLTLLLLRCGLGLVFIYHGYPKLFGSTERLVESFQSIGLPAYFVYVAGVIEFFGGLAIALGLFTPVVGIILLLEMAVAMWKYNFNEGIYAVREYELPLVLGLASLAVAATGPGKFSLDHRIFRRTERHVDEPQTSH